jgi:hypothetical protein
MGLVIFILGILTIVGVPYFLVKINYEEASEADKMATEAGKMAVEAELDKLFSGEMPPLYCGRILSSQTDEDKKAAEAEKKAVETELDKLFSGETPPLCNRYGYIS